MDPITRLLMQGSAGAREKVYVEDVFSTWLYTGNGSTQTITNGIDLSGEGGLVWIKGRGGATNHRLFDTAQGATNFLESNSTAQQQSSGASLTSFNSSGFSIGASSPINTNAATYASWTFRKAEKFFDVVTWTGNGTSGRAIPHNLGSAPGFIAVKILSASDNWECYHRGVTFNSGNVLWLNSANALTTGGPRFTSVPDATNFYLGSDSGVNGSGATYVAYLFAHDTTADGLIQCGSMTNAAAVNLGWEPQWVLLKRSDSTGGWFLLDTMRGLDSSTTSAALFANLSDAEASAGYGWSINATGFTGAAAGTYIYIAIRRGPMRTPTDATKVFAAQLGNNSGTPEYTAGFPVDMAIAKSQAGSATDVASRLTQGAYLQASNTNAEATSALYNFAFQDGYFSGSSNWFSWMFRRAPGFFDVVAYTGTGAARTVSHNLGVVPEFCIVKRRDATAFWPTWSSAFTSFQYVALNETSSKYDDGSSNQTFSFTSTGWSIGTTYSSVNASGATYIAYLLASCPGVSKVGSYTGTGTTQQINCGFTAGARFVLIKRTDSTGDWYVWDSARGITAGNDPYLLLNSTAAEVTNTDFVDTFSSGFEISSTAPAAINANGGSFIFLAIA